MVTGLINWKETFHKNALDQKLNCHSRGQKRFVKKQSFAISCQIVQKMAIIF